MFQLNDPGKSWWFGQFKRCWGCYETRAWPSAVVAHSWIHIYQHLYSNIRKTPQFQCAFCTPEQLTAFTLTPPSLSLFCGEEAVCYRTDGFTYGNTGMLKAAEERSLPGLFFFSFFFPCWFIGKQTTLWHPSWFTQEFLVQVEQQTNKLQTKQHFHRAT